ncbi:hypothetical protein PSN45_000243 [Yamadazyma tenuis]|uniref:Glia maturation factor beta n=1 Tax=Candida tenuis (strain ATCC 10573 / BCRC 21748 / CBS 615 / JCM 9827 / NBRC 10315 / NRRL Y-1498 / VKM Y-70) TaxID=590646 RepID=G3BBL1_CANTC|nr:uncharacterized protein CANTEDRAFT_115032 [Yamadazyma tenuis ATCC 10573]XP_006688735.1 glia maturation factor beta [Yamadazyma tenuis ATCC 10573]EGV62564.1 hypothetical protein CANTEDRAFT_115032 [Yamadazyma tenuis ATCC 10573]EGV62565.1 glia maturation factor beta [Yamadazyma tenuis ATCC 10573]WEJ92787.1 hypothetical protein PSN45_000243 [Yamadazyma tenuis]
MSTNLYTFASPTLSGIQKFRFSSARAPGMQAIIYIIDKSSYEVKREDEDQVITSIEELEEELPPNAPRFVILSYPYKTRDGRSVSPLVMLYWKPATCGQQSKMLYAGALELFRDKAGVSKLVSIEDEEELGSIQDLIQ